MKAGYVQVYTGDGKGKTTAAIGLAVRAVGAGMKVFFAQFLKSGDFSEIKALRCFAKDIDLVQFGSGRFVRGRPDRNEFELADKGFEQAKAAVFSGKYDLIVLDEANVAMNLGLIRVTEMLKLIEDRPAHVELVLTGRWAPIEIIEVADLVTECRSIRHYFERGIAAREGIEK
jgi:cob(I)alamin adenosyltransferase